MFYKRALLMSCLALCIYSGCVVNPVTGKRELMLVAESNDIEIGQKYAPEITKELGGEIQDAALQSYINNVGQKIAAVCDSPDWEFHFAAVVDDSVNAFALPGGYIFITKGLLTKLQTEAQLAAILGHEIVHVVARDTANVMSREIGLNILLSAVTSEQTPETVTTVANLTKQIVGLSYSRKDERTADLGGLKYIAKAGYDPRGMLQTMQILQSLSEASTIDFFSTHPSPENRIGYINEEIQKKYSNTANPRIGKEDYQKNILNRLN
ncbi:MAG: M48 family metalloprotease [Sedimentisphaerales bacterium]|nr:M48 family metalloprotease [Sedimentisphaerales bacterium]